MCRPWSNPLMLILASIHSTRGPQPPGHGPAPAVRSAVALDQKKKCTMNIMHLNHPETSAHPRNPWSMENCLP